MNMLALLNPADEPMLEAARPVVSDTGGLVIETQCETSYAARSLIMLGSKDDTDAKMSPRRILNYEPTVRSPVLLPAYNPSFHMSPLGSKAVGPAPGWSAIGIAVPHDNEEIHPPLKRRLGSVSSEVDMAAYDSPSTFATPTPTQDRPDYCSVTGCLRLPSHLNQGKCAVHKGMKLCQIDGCFRPVQSRGCCKSHGGGARCKYPDCTKGAISKGRCRSHGGGTRCAVPECFKWAQRFGCCVRHSKAVAPKPQIL